MSGQPNKETEKKRELYTSPGVRNRVIERNMKGESMRTIAKEEGIDRGTVSRILSQRELVEMLASQQSRLLRMSSKAIDVYERALESDDLPLAVATATKLLEGTGVLDKRGLQGTIDQSLTRSVLRGTTVPPEFQKDPNEVVETKDNERIPRMPPMPVLEMPNKAEGEDQGQSS